MAHFLCIKIYQYCLKTQLIYNYSRDSKFFAVRFVLYSLLLFIYQVFEVVAGNHTAVHDGIVSSCDVTYQPVRTKHR